MKTILIAVLLQLSVDGDGKPTPQVMATVTSEFESKDACRNAIAGLHALGEASGFKVNAICAPKDIGKLEVEKPPAGVVKPKAPPQPIPRGSTAS